jgi:hypothetical protein
MRLTLRVGKQFRAIELVVQIALVIAGKQNQMQMSERLAVLPAKDTDGDGFVVDHRKALNRAAYRRGQQSDSGGKRECKRSDHEYTP